MDYRAWVIRCTRAFRATATMSGTMRAPAAAATSSAAAAGCRALPCLPKQRSVCPPAPLAIRPSVRVCSQQDEQQAVTGAWRLGVDSRAWRSACPVTVRWTRPAPLLRAHAEAAPAVEQQQQQASQYPVPPPPFYPGYGPPPGADASTAAFPPGVPPSYYQQASVARSAVPPALAILTLALLARARGSPRWPSFSNLMMMSDSSSAPEARDERQRRALPARLAPDDVVQARPGQEAYYGYYPVPPPPPPAAYKQESSGGTPWWIWVGVGVIAANVFNKVRPRGRGAGDVAQSGLAAASIGQAHACVGAGGHARRCRSSCATPRRRSR